MKPAFEDLELLEALRDEPELLAFADALQHVERDRLTLSRRGRRRVGVVLVGAAAVAAALAILFIGLGSSTSFTDRALAAIAPARIVHAVVVYPTDDRLIDTETGSAVAAPLVVEEWFDSSTGQALFIARVARRTGSTSYTDAKGHLYTEQGRSGGLAGRGRVDAPIATFLDGYRTALRERRAKDL